jgi:hypothetical protein
VRQEEGRRGKRREEEGRGEKRREEEGRGGRKKEGRKRELTMIGQLSLVQIGFPNSVGEKRRERRKEEERGGKRREEEGRGGKRREEEGRGEKRREEEGRGGRTHNDRTIIACPNRLPRLRMRKMSLLQFLNILLHPLDQMGFVVENHVVGRGAGHHLVLLHDLEFHFFRGGEDGEGLGRGQFVLLGEG